MKKDFIKDLLSESNKASTIRLMSILMFAVATFYLFYSYHDLINNTEEITMWVVILHIGQNLINYLFAFFPKIIQKKFEQVDINKISGNK
jgi:divalent metal cation (Fe/Co/Zn/Cd) transporter